MSKSRIIYIISLIIMSVLMLFTVFKPMASEERFTEVSRESIIHTEDEWIIQFDIINKEGKDTDYIINWSTGEEVYRRKEVSIAGGRSFTNIHHVNPDGMKEGKLKLEIYKKGEPTPFEQTSYFLE